MATKSILEFVDASQVLSYARQLDPTIFFGLKLFTPRMVDELDYSYIKGAGGSKAAIMADVVGFDTPSPLVPHESLDQVEGSLAPLKQKSVVNEKEILKIFSPRTSREKSAAITRLYNDVADRVTGVYAGLNWIVCQALGTGKAIFNTERSKFTIDWGLPGTHKVTKTSTAEWDDLDDSNPIQDLINLQAVIKADTGITCDRAITSTTVINYMLQNVKIRQQMFGVAETARILTLPQLNAMLASLGLPIVFAYDEQVKSVATGYTLSTARFFPEKNLTMFSSQEVLGETLFGPTAEAIRGIGGEEAPGIFAEVYEQRDPVSVWTYAVANAMPTFPGIDGIGVIETYS